MSDLQSWLNRSFTCACGNTHHVSIKNVTIKEGALQEVPPYLVSAGYDDVLLVADDNTWKAAGRELQQLCRDTAVAADVCLLEPNENGEIAADEVAIVQVLLRLNAGTKAVLAVGSGTIHDIVRFVCHKTGRPFLSVPTAPSVDGFTSVGAPLIVRGFKQTIPAVAPEAMFADSNVMAGAPQPMIAAGFGDMLGKFTSLADWELGRELFGESYCQTSVDLTREAVRLCLEHLSDISAGTAAGVSRLMEALTLSGISMLLVGNSRPASGSEHHLSHYWEMQYIMQKKPALLHGAKVGAAAVLMAGLYERLGKLTKEEALARLRSKPLPSRAEEEARIREGYGSIAAQVVAENFTGSAVLDESVLEERFEKQWEAISSIAGSVPAPAQLAEWLGQSGGPATTEQLGVPQQLVDASLRFAMYVRSRYTVLRLMRLLPEA